MQKMLLVPAALLAIAGCDGLRSALSAHTDVAARAGSQELSTQQLADLIGKSSVPLIPDAAENQKMARAVADVWVNYQLIGRTAAQNDSLNDPRAMDKALWREINQAKIEKFHGIVSKTWVSTDTIATEADYMQGRVLSAAHILFEFPPNGGPKQVDSVKKVAEAVRKNVTLGNFADMVQKHSKDRGSLQTKGLYPAFPKGMMVPEFENAVMSLKPGEISGVVQSVHGYHIIRRPMFEEVKAEVGIKKGEMLTKVAESTFVARVQDDGKIEVRKNATELVRKVAEDVDGNRDNKAILASSKAGKYTAADFARLLRSFPQRQQVVQQLMQMPDTVVPLVVKELVRTDLLVRLADSAKAVPDSSELAAIRSQLTRVLVSAWQQLGVEPATLGDSAQNEAARMRVAGARVDSFMVGLMSATRMYVAVPDPLEVLLRGKHSYSISASGLSRALEQAMKVRATLDSARDREMKNAPPTNVPMPDRGGGPPDPAAAGKVPPPPGRGRG